MGHGHVTGNKREKVRTSDWYRQIDEENIQRIECEYEERHAVAMVLRQLPRQEREERED